MDVWFCQKLLNYFPDWPFGTGNSWLPFCIPTRSVWEIQFHIPVFLFGSSCGFLELLYNSISSPVLWNMERQPSGEQPKGRDLHAPAWKEEKSAGIHGHCVLGIWMDLKSWERWSHPRREKAQPSGHVREMRRGVSKGPWRRSSQGVKGRPSQWCSSEMHLELFLPN